MHACFFVVIEYKYRWISLSGWSRQTELQLHWAIGVSDGVVAPADHFTATGRRQISHIRPRRARVVLGETVEHKREPDLHPRRACGFCRCTFKSWACTVTRGGRRQSSLKSFSGSKSSLKLFHLIINQVATFGLMIRLPLVLFCMKQK